VPGPSAIIAFGDVEEWLECAPMMKMPVSGRSS
jgi:hypothetical protein